MSEMSAELKEALQDLESRMTKRLDELHERLDEVEVNVEKRFQGSRHEYMDLYKATEARLSYVKSLIEPPARTLQEATLRMLRGFQEERDEELYGLPKKKIDPSL